MREGESATRLAPSWECGRSEGVCGGVWALKRSEAIPAKGPKTLSTYRCKMASQVGTSSVAKQQRKLRTRLAWTWCPPVLGLTHVREGDYGPIRLELWHSCCVGGHGTSP